MAGDGINQNQSQFYVVVSEEKTENPEEISANFYMNELIRKSSEEQSPQQPLQQPPIQSSRFRFPH